MVPPPFLQFPAPLNGHAQYRGEQEEEQEEALPSDCLYSDRTGDVYSDRKGVGYGQRTGRFGGRINRTASTSSERTASSGSDRTGYNSSGRTASIGRTSSVERTASIELTTSVGRTASLGRTASIGADLTSSGHRQRLAVTSPQLSSSQTIYRQSSSRGSSQSSPWSSTPPGNLMEGGSGHQGAKELSQGAKDPSEPNNNKRNTVKGKTNILPSW